MFFLRTFFDSRPGLTVPDNIILIFYMFKSDFPVRFSFLYVTPLFVTVLIGFGFGVWIILIVWISTMDNVLVLYGLVLIK